MREKRKTKQQRRTLRKMLNQYLVKLKKQGLMKMILKQ